MSYLPEGPTDRTSGSGSLVPVSIFIAAGVMYLLLTALMMATHRYEFLAAYLAAGIGTLIGSFVIRHRVESGDIPRVDLNDAYLIGFLRGGPNEVLRLATLSLIERKLLSPEGRNLVTAPGTDLSTIKNLIERRILGLFITRGEAKTMFSDPQLKGYCEEFRLELIQLGLLPNERQNSARLIRLGVCLSMILGVALTKIVVALVQGHHNIGFTIILAVFFTLILVLTAFPKRTVTGDRFLEDLRRIYSESKQQAPLMLTGGGGEQVLMLSAVFGFAALPNETYPYARELFPAAASSTTSSGCGSSCGSSCGGGGGGCGGGGCGGGCGG